MPDQNYRGEDPLASLREALKLSPENIPLRLHLAESLLALDRIEEAEEEFRQGLSLDPQNAPLLRGMVRLYLQQGKNSPAFVIVEDLLQRNPGDLQARLFLARILYRTGEVYRAREEYRKVILVDHSLADPSVEDEIGFNASGEEAPKERIRVRSDESGEEEGIDLYVERPVVTFHDVGGMEKLKEEIRLKIIYPLKNPEIYKAYGKSIGGGILMYGPPGCGKTHLARATAGEVNAGFISVGINDILDMWMGQSEKNLHEIFEQARAYAPCVLFFDEVDALGASRSDMRQSAGRQLINQFLSELDGVESSNEGVLILAATNAPWHLDPAFRRPGRFDRILFVPPPDDEAREAILRILLKGKPMKDVDYRAVAKKSRDFSGADLKAVVDLSVEAKLQEALKKGVPSPLTTGDLLASVKRLRPTTKEWFSTARNYALYSNQGGAYDEILEYLKLK